MRASFVLSGVATGVRRNATMTIALILSTSIALAFVGAALLANTEITKFKHVYEGKINISVYLCATLHDKDPNCKHKTTPDETAAIRSQLDQDPLVSSASYVSEQEQYSNTPWCLPHRCCLDKVSPHLLIMLLWIRADAQ